MNRLLALSFSVLLAANFAVAGEPSGHTPQVECTTPDGRMVAVPTQNTPNSPGPALLVGDDTLACPLQQGETTFVIKLSGASFLDRFTFVNENAEAAGRLKISVSNDPLPADSAKWVQVDGNIAFNRKRLFHVSTVGVDARYVKLSFVVDQAERIAAVDL
ncbi:MAG: hypothetical protein ABI992_04595 [Chthoniobacterales bacterium]